MNQKKKEDGSTVKIEDMYNYNPKKMKARITAVQYTNQAWIQVNPRDVIIDFLQMPGYPEGENTTVPALRIYLSHAHAQNFAHLLIKTLKDVHSKGLLEKYKDVDTINEIPK